MAYLKSTNWRWIIATASLCTVVGMAPAFAQTSGTAERGAGEISKVTQEVSQEIYSPYCPGKTLAMCPSGGASDVRQEIQQLARQGEDKQAIKETIIAKYGEEFRMVEPPAEDNYALLTLLAGAFTLCLLAIWFFATRRSSRDAEEADKMSEEDLSEDDRAYLDELRGEYME